jgi:hypothetical protein
MNAALPFTLVDANARNVDAALPALVGLLQACVAGGASIGWPTTPSDDVAAAFWRGCIDATRRGERRFWLALADAADPACRWSAARSWPLPACPTAATAPT